MSEVNRIIQDLEFCDSVFDYTLTPDDCGLLLGYIQELQQENQKLKEDYDCALLLKDDEVGKNLLQILDKVKE